MTEFSVPFRLGPIEVDPRVDELRCGESSLTIQSMAMKVLCYLAAKPDEVISRDELRDSLWQNRIASNQTINNHIYNLRRALASLDENTKYIHTVTGSGGNGYRLLVAVEVIEQTVEPEIKAFGASDPETVEPGAIKTPPKKLGGVDGKHGTTLMSLLLLIVVSWFLYDLFNPLLYNESKGLTIMQGREQSPAVASDGRFVIYSHRQYREGYWELYAGFLDRPEQIIKVFDGGEHDDNFVTISPSHQKIAFNRLVLGQEGIYVADFNADTLTASNARRVIALDRENLSPAISWLDDEQFFYTAKETAKAPLRIYLYDFKTQNSSQVSSPPLGTFGDFAVMLSPDKKWLAVMRAEGYMGFRLLMYDVEQKSFVQTDVTAVEQRLNISFSDNSEAVYFIDDEGFLSQYAIDDKTIERISSKPYLGYWPLKVPGKNQFIMQQDWGLSSLTTQIIRYNNPRVGGDGKASLAVNNGLSIRSIEGVADGLVFAAIKPNFHIELWRYRDGRAYKLDQFHEKPEYRYPLSLDWRRDSDKVLLSINNSCRLVDIKDGSDSPLCPEKKQVYGGTFADTVADITASSTGKIQSGSSGEGGPQIYLAERIEESATAYVMGSTGYPFKRVGDMPSAGLIKQGVDGELYYRQDPGFDIYHHDSKTGENRLLIDRTYLNHGYSTNDFVVVEQGIYFMDKKQGKRNAVYFYQFDNGQISHVINSPNEYPNIALSADERHIYQIQSIDNDSQLRIVQANR